MRKFLSLSIALIAVLSIATMAGASSPPGKNRIRCEADAPATSTTNGAQGCDFVVPTTGGAAFAYYGTTAPYSPNGWDKPLGQIGQLSFRYSGTDPAGALRWSLQISLNGTSPELDYVFVGADACNDGAGLVDVLNDATCNIYYGANVYPNWAAFVATQPTTATLWFAFVVADAPGTWSITSVKIGKPGK